MVLCENTYFVTGWNVYSLKLNKVTMVKMRYEPQLEILDLKPGGNFAWLKDTTKIPVPILKQLSKKSHWNGRLGTAEKLTYLHLLAPHSKLVNGVCVCVCVCSLCSRKLQKIYLYFWKVHNMFFCIWKCQPEIYY